MFGTETPQVREILAAIRNKTILLPEFQRGFVWDARKKCIPFLDSLYRRYPTGGLLLWRTQQPAPEGHAKPGQWVELLLDGQQRMTLLYALVYGEPPSFYAPEVSKPLPTDWYFNPNSEAFDFRGDGGRVTDPPSVEWLPVRLLVAEEHDLFAKANHPDNPLGLAPEQIRLINDKGHPILKVMAILNYRYYVRYLDDEREGKYDISQVVEVFDRVNTGGEHLSLADVMIAHMSVRWPEVRRELRDLRQELARGGFEFGVDLLARCVGAAATRSGIIRTAWQDVGAQEVREWWPRARRALQNLANLLRSNAFIPSAAPVEMPSHAPIVTLTAYLSYRPNQQFLSERERNLMLGWLWLALGRARYSGRAERALDDDLAPLRRDRDKWRAEDVVKTLLYNLWRQRGRLWVVPEELTVGPNAAIFRLIKTVMRARRAVDWATGQPLFLPERTGSQNALEVHHIFPRAYLRRSGYDVGGQTHPDHKRMLNEIGNLALVTAVTNREILDRAPAEYLPELDSRFPGASQTQLVPQATELWTAERFPDFLSERRKLIARETNDFLQEKLGDVLEQIEERPC